MKEKIDILFIFQLLLVAISCREKIVILREGGIELYLESLCEYTVKPV